jgi:predicted PurR-regulated permease PerM
MNRGLQTLATAALVIGLLHFAQSVLAPLAIAVLLAVVLAPLVRRLELRAGRLVGGRVGAVLVVSAAVALAFAGMGWLIATQGRSLAAEIPQYSRVVVDRFRELRGPLDSLQRAAREVQAVAGVSDPAPARVQVVEGNSGLLSMLTGWAGSVASLLGTAGLVIVLLIFVLIEREDLRNRLIRIAGPANMRRATSTLSDATQRITTYLRALALLNFGHGLIVGLGLWAIGLPGAPLFGLLSALLRFVPYVGPWIAACAPIALSIAVFDTWTLPLVIVSFFVVLELASNNLLEPWFFGSSVGLSPFGVILSAIFWAWLWGPIGLVLATPLTACLVVLGRHVPRLGSLAILLSDAEPLKPAQRLYQRLLARDVDEATDLVAEHVHKDGDVAAWDEVVLPALCMLEQDHQDRLLQPDEIDCARDTIEILLAELPEPKTLDDSDGTVLCLPARSWADEVACRALARLLGAAGTPAAASGRRLTAELAELVAQTPAPAICIWSLDAQGTGSVRHLLMRVRNRRPEIGVVVGVCGESEWSAHVRERLGAENRTEVVESFSAAIDLLPRRAR